MSYKVEVKVKGEKEFVSNALRFPTREMAEKDGRSLACRWLAIDEWRVMESTDPIYYYDRDSLIKGKEV